MENEVYMITPKGIAVLALLESGLVTSFEDPRIDGFWKLFEFGMQERGYVKYED